MRIKYAWTFSFFIVGLLYVQLLEGQNRYGLVWAVVINPPELSLNDEARNDAQQTLIEVLLRKTSIQAVFKTSKFSLKAL